VAGGLAGRGRWPAPSPEAAAMLYGFSSLSAATRGADGQCLRGSGGDAVATHSPVTYGVAGEGGSWGRAAGPLLLAALVGCRHDSAELGGAAAALTAFSQQRLLAGVEDSSPLALLCGTSVLLLREKRQQTGWPQAGRCHL